MTDAPLILAIDEGHLEASPGCIPRDARAVDAAADDEDVDVRYAVLRTGVRHITS